MEPLSPPPKLRKQWIDESPGLALDGHTRVGTDWNAVMDRAAEWGADHAMTMDRARAAKAALIEDIQALLNDFTAKTGCAIDSAEIVPFTSSRGVYGYGVQLHIQL